LPLAQKRTPVNDEQFTDETFPGTALIFVPIPIKPYSYEDVTNPVILAAPAVEPVAPGDCM